LLQLITLLDGVAAYFQFARNARKKARLATNSESSNQKQAEVDVTHQSSTESHGQPTSTPPIISHITVGINEVTKALETEIRSSRQVVVTSDTTSDTTQPLTSVIFICHADLDTPAIVAHLPQLLALCNSARPHGQKIKVVPLPAGAQSSIADALGFTRRVSVMALDVSSFRHGHYWVLTILQNSTPGLSQLEPFLATVIDPPASWLTSIQGTALEPSHIKQLLTSAPKDMKAAKERRMQGRAAAKERRRLKSQLARVGTSS
jgi:ribonuclease P/MRP protein subunit POP3